MYLVALYMRVPPSHAHLNHHSHHPKAQPGDSRSHIQLDYEVFHQSP